jgi:hypothetical protein
MKRVFTGASLADIGHFRNLLEQVGIHCFIKNEQLTGALGELPIFDCQPELWVYLDEQAASAAAVIEKSLAGGEEARGRPWRCPRCGESNEGQFAACWSCGAAAAG